MQINSGAPARFWRWFGANGRRLRAAMYGDDDEAREAAAEELRVAVQQVQEGLVLEMGPPPEEGPGDLIVSADGRRELVDAVKDFVASAPALPGWNVIAFRTRMPVGESLSIRLQDEEVSPEDISFRIAEEDGLELTLLVRGLTPENRRVRGLGAMLLAEHAIGERDALTLLSGLDVEPMPEDPHGPGLRPFRDLVGVFDEVRERKYPPPGSLPLDPEQAGWQALRGTLNGSPAMILLNVGLRPVAGHPAYDQRLVVSVPFNEARDDGMPGSEEEYLAVQEIGERLADALLEGQECLLGLTIMTQGRRDLILYTSNAESSLRKLEELRAGIESHEVQADVERDTFWGLYRNFVHGAENAEEGAEEE
jgi:hypothetical protein